MTPEQVNLVQQSFAKVAPISEQAAVLFYGRLFEVAPGVRAMFPDDMTEQRKKLMATLAVVVNGLTNLEAVLPAASALAKTTAPRPSTIPSSVARCCGLWKKGSVRPGRRKPRQPGLRLTARCPVT
jgi:hypothetical protein